MRIVVEPYLVNRCTLNVLRTKLNWFIRFMMRLQEMDLRSTTFSKWVTESLLQHSNTKANLVEMFRQMKIYSLRKIVKESLSQWKRRIWI
jgi:hypothetical protein